MFLGFLIRAVRVVFLTAEGRAVSGVEVSTLIALPSHERSSL
jgi:hypothetical protein